MASNRCGWCGHKLEADGTCSNVANHISSAKEFKAETEAEASRRRLAQSVQELGNLPKFLRELYEILQEKGIDLVDLKAANIERIKFWQSMHKDETGEAVVTDLQGITLSPGWENGPQWPIVQPSKSFKLTPTKSAPKKRNGDLKVCVVLPDMQIGYFHSGDPRNPMLEPIHDERAMDIALMVIKEIRPDKIVMLGDNLDLAEFGKYRQYPQYAGTTQMSLDRAGGFLAELQSISPESEKVWLEGNHEVRLPNMIIDNAKAAYGLRKAGDGFRDLPTLSVPSLLRFEEYGVEWVSGYPGGEYQITKWLKAIHGKYVKSDSATAQTYLRKGWDSVLFGHVHRIERLDQTKMTSKGPRTRIAASPGCLCRIDGVVPSTMGGMDVYGRPVPVAENWQQGLMVVDYEDTGWYNLDQITIWSGRTVWRGKEYVSELSETHMHSSVMPNE